MFYSYHRSLKSNINILFIVCSINKTTLNLQTNTTVLLVIKFKTKRWMSLINFNNNLKAYNSFVITKKQRMLNKFSDYSA